MTGKSNIARQTPANSGHYHHLCWQTLAPRCIGLARLVLRPGSSSLDCTRCSEIDSDSRYLSNSIGVYEFISLRRANDLRVFMFFELKSVTRGFSKALLIGGGDFGCVYRGVVRVLGLDVEIDDEDDDGDALP
ncbi:hypothetical protein F8388_007564 [Cannabis sativa]|uniref:Uncharacterized protein n=1 Tax=Cannabis sativa TaxID=3483 RepID=A0A7J6ET27_CANSA|nr:hypothetical protein F8388_007564 [Cannabis sativa]